MLGAEGVVRHVRQAERSDTVPDLVVAPILVARDQRVVRRKLKIEALAHLSACVRIGKRAGELRDLKRGGIHNRRVHHGKIVEIPSLDVGEKGNPLAQRSPEISLVVLRIVARRCCTTRERVSRVDRKSTRLNSSHVAISYAVFCLKKKTDQWEVSRIKIHIQASF